MNPDTELVQHYLKGDRAAFEQIVSRYQSLVCSIAYNQTGDLAACEDIAQETFIAAWNQLKNLRDWQKLRSWLCGITRNLSQEYLRKRYKENSRKEAAFEASSLTQKPISAITELINQEEQSLLWQALQEIPETYREPLILYYWEDKSTLKVAEYLELSDETVRQRLSRGRAMLREQMADIVERNLQKTAPNPAFTHAVMAVLPSIQGLAISFSIAGLLAKSGITAKTTAVSTGLSGLGFGVLGYIYGGSIGLLIGFLAGCLGALVGVYALSTNLKYLNHPAYRESVIRAWVIPGYTLLFLLMTNLTLWGYLAIGIVSLALWFDRRRLKSKEFTKAQMYTCFAGNIFGVTLWLLVLLLQQGNWHYAGLLMIVNIILFGLSIQLSLKYPERVFIIAAWTQIPVCLINLSLYHVILHTYNSGTSKVKPGYLYLEQLGFRTWMVDALILCLFGIVFLSLLILDKVRERSKS